MPNAAFIAAPQRRTKAAFGICSALALGAIGKWLISGAPTPATPPPAPPLARAEGVHSLIVRENGVKLWELAAQRIDLAGDHGGAVATGVNRAVLYQQGSPSWTLQAGSVRLSGSSHDVDATGGVSAVGPQKLRLATRRAIWRPGKGTIECAQPISATGRGMKITAGAAYYDMKRDELRCVSRVSVTTAYLQLRSPRARAQFRRGLVRFEGGVDITIHARAGRPGKAATAGARQQP